MATVCISHKEDVDGIVCATMIKSIFTGYPFLADYTDFIPILEHVANMQDVERIFICDLGLSKANEKRFIEILQDSRRKEVDITYIDHHDLADEVKDKLKKSGITIIHTTDECASVQIYEKFSDKLPKGFALLAVCASIIDDMKNSPIANKLYQMYDKQFVFFEATSLSYAIYENQHNIDFLLSLVSELCTTFPHEISGILDSAKNYAQKVSANLAVIEKGAKRMKNLVYMETSDLSTSIVANMLLASYQDFQAALAYKEKNGNYVLSLRGTASSRHHLGRSVNKLSVELGGSGGGHEKACGALIPKEKLNELIEKIASILT
ncbi:MAG: DHHA1 domain-containing protein [Nitrososphaerales archaeon]